ncbi:MAG: HD domain-containing protein [Brevinematales bacterium]
MNTNIQISTLLDNTKYVKVLQELENIFCSWYEKKYFEKVRKSFQITYLLFNGKFPGYKECNTEYHDFNHTVDALVAATRLMDGYNFQVKIMNVNTARNLLIACLLHDTGYIQEKDDNIGTGAKYTKYHVDRSIEFLFKNKEFFSIEDNDAQEIKNYISSTGLNVKWETIPFKNQDERIAGGILGTADLLGQMADRKYLEKLLFLYYEFKEAGIPGYDTEFDILRKTVDFYKITKERLDTTLLKIYEYATEHFKQRYNIPYNLYMLAIERNIDYINEILKDNTTNFRKKLRRLDIENLEKKYKSNYIFLG